MTPWYKFMMGGRAYRMRYDWVALLRELVGKPFTAEEQIERALR